MLVSLLAGVPAEAGPISRLIDLKGSQWRTAKEKSITDGPHPMLEDKKILRMKKHSAGANKLTIHYTGSKKDDRFPLKTKLQKLFNFSTRVLTKQTKKEYWGDIPYHFYIDLHGKIAETRDMNFRPDTNTGYNTDGHITIVVEGDKSEGLSDNQKAKLWALMKAIQIEKRIPFSRVGMHRHLPDNKGSTDCPGPAVESAVRQYLKTMKARRK
jgi:hypothetical protein